MVLINYIRLGTGKKTPISIENKSSKFKKIKKFGSTMVLINCISTKQYSDLNFKL